MNASGESIILLSKELEPEPVPVYNFEVENAHTYFVGTSRKESVLVHNDCSGSNWHIPTAEELGLNKVCRRISHWIGNALWNLGGPPRKHSEVFPNGVDWTPQPVPEEIHFALEGISLCPIPGCSEGADLLNFSFYALEGRYEDAGVALAGFGIAGAFVVTSKGLFKVIDVNVLKNSGRTAAESLSEKLAMEAVQANPGTGTVLTNIDLGDPRWPGSEGWVKMSQTVNGINIHYVHNPKTGVFDDFKFKDIDPSKSGP